MTRCRQCNDDNDNVHDKNGYDNDQENGLKKPNPPRNPKARATQKLARNKNKGNPKDKSYAKHGKSKETQRKIKAESKPNQWKSKGKSKENQRKIKGTAKEN